MTALPRRHPRAPPLALILILSPALTRAHELCALGGAQYTRTLNELTCGFSYEYLQNLSGTAR